MATHRFTRRHFTFTMLSAPLWASAVQAATLRKSITEFGAKADDATINTKSIQAAIDDLAKQGGGTVVVPQGVFVSGALFLKPKVNLHLDKGAVLKCSTDLKNFPVQRTRIEGHFEDAFNPALINANGCDGFQLTGEGTLDGAGRPIWDQFWRERNAVKDKNNFANLSVPRARLALIENSRNVLVDGVTFKDSQFWNLHLYKCQDTTVRNARFVVPDDYKQAPSTDGIDLDSCQRILVEGCYFSVTDDCIAAKGTKGPLALEDKDSPPTEHIRVRNCVFKRGHAVFTLGSEATIVRDVIVENSTAQHVDIVAHLKLRPDTPQHYEDIHFRNFTLDWDQGVIVSAKPWTQYFDLKGHKPPKSIVRNVTLTGFKGRLGGFGTLKANPGQTTISGVSIKDFDVKLGQPKLSVDTQDYVKFDNVVVNGKPYQA